MCKCEEERELPARGRQLAWCLTMPSSREPNFHGACGLLEPAVMPECTQPYIRVCVGGTSCMGVYLRHVELTGSLFGFCSNATKPRAQSLQFVP